METLWPFIYPAALVLLLLFVGGLTLAVKSLDTELQSTRQRLALLTTNMDRLETRAFNQTGVVSVPLTQPPTPRDDNDASELNALLAAVIRDRERNRPPVGKPAIERLLEGE